ncbi:MAG: EamA family transporter [Enterocloster asparagiformis]|nr:EamA family transporter [Enterocloster asparagiformis]
MDRNHVIAKAEIIGSMAVFGTIAIFVRNIPLPSAELAVCRAVIAAATLLVWQLLTGNLVRFQDIKKELPLLFLSGAAMGINWILFFQAYKYTSVALATLSYYFAPVIVTAASPFLFKEKVTKRQLLCFVMSTLGLVLVIGVRGAGGERDTIGVLFGLGAAVFYAAVVLCNKGIRNVTGINRTFLQFLASIVVLLPYVALTGGFHLAGLPSGGIFSLLVVGVVYTGLAYTLYFSSLRYLKGQEAAILSYIDPLVAVLVSITVLSESITWLQAAGGAMILGFTILNELKPRMTSGTQGL